MADIIIGPLQTCIDYQYFVVYHLLFLGLEEGAGCGADTAGLLLETVDCMWLTGTLTCAVCSGGDEEGIMEGDRSCFRLVFMRYSLLLCVAIHHEVTISTQKYVWIPHICL